MGYVEGHGSTDEDGNVAPLNRSLRLTITKTTPLPPQGTVAMPAATTAAVVAHRAATPQHKETLGQEAHGASSQKAQT
ncbi:hypothetical protein C1H46_003066 [Malus baccata]|uniref:Uncharacterized protein n=1 Tax=Malus baccata TaxID=106549 RepID=A0A540NJW1_MALBA|nr:hypothetical protein C1H46_003066 [Malus baccata]